MPYTLVETDLINRKRGTTSGGGVKATAEESYVPENGEIGRWGEHRFVVSSTLIRSFSDLQIIGSSKIEEKENEGKTKTKSLKGEPSEISLTVKLFASLGCQVREEVTSFVNEAANATEGYFYLGGKRVLDCKLMLASATAKEIDILPNGTWAKATVALSFKQSDIPADNSGSGSGSSGGNGGGSNKESVNTAKTLTQKDKPKIEYYIPKQKTEQEQKMDLYVAITKSNMPEQNKTKAILNLGMGPLNTDSSWVEKGKKALEATKKATNAAKSQPNTVKLPVPTPSSLTKTTAKATSAAQKISQTVAKKNAAVKQAVRDGVMLKK